MVVSEELVGRAGVTEAKDVAWRQTHGSIEDSAVVDERAMGAVKVLKHECTLVLPELDDGMLRLDRWRLRFVRHVRGVNLC